MKRRTFFLFFVLLLLTSSCGQDTSEHQKYLFAMDTVMDLKVFGAQGEAGLEETVGIIQALEQELSATDPESRLSTLNASKVLEPVGDDFAALLELSAQLGERTGGALDITVYPVVKAWGFTEDVCRVPDQAELEKLLEYVDWSLVGWDGTKASLPEGVQIDFGSLAKGYAGKKAAEALRELGVSSAILNLGGNVQTVGTRTDGEEWKIAVKNPLNPESEDYLGIILASDQAVVTSGGYERFFEENGQKYWHIIDPTTGTPARSGLISVTVVAEDGALCDGLSTALFILGREKAIEYWREWGGFEAVLVEENGTVTVTSGLKDKFTLLNESYTLLTAD